MLNYKSKHVFGPEANVDGALLSGEIDSFDILFLDEGKIGWITENGKKFIIEDKKQVRIESELPSKGEPNVLFVCGKSLYIWNGSEYLAIVDDYTALKDRVSKLEKSEVVTSVNGKTGDVSIDIPSIEGLATEDYVNDSLTNITWDYIGIKKEELFNDTLSGFAAVDGVMNIEPALFPLVVGLEYEVVWDGVSYVVECIDYNGHVVIGKYINSQAENYPFGIRYANAQTSIAARNQDGLLDWETDSHSIAITVYGVKQVPVKYIPEHTHSDLAAVEHIHSWDELTDRPVNIEYIPTSASKTVTASESTKSVSLIPPVGYLENRKAKIHEGAIIDIYLNDELYGSINCDDYTIAAGTSIIYKNDAVYGGLTCTFKTDSKTRLLTTAIVVPPLAEDTVVTVTYKYPVITFKDEFISDNIARKSYVDQQIAAIPKVELVQADWNVNDETSGAYIKNRPFYVESCKYTILPESTITTSSDMTSVNITYTPVVPLVEGESYTVVWDNVEYNCIGTIVDGLVAVGNAAAFGLENDTGEPFLIAINEDMFGGAFIFAFSIGEHTVAISVDGEIVHKFDPKFIPDEVRSDWNQNDPTAINYIENRPFYEKEADVELSFESEIDIPDNGEGIYFHYTNYDQTIDNPIVVDGLYRVIYDGVVYDNVSVYENYGYRMLGFRYNSADSIYPFYISHRYDNIDQVNFGATTPGLHTYQVYKMLSSSELVQLDEKFIPETIARVDDVASLSRLELLHKMEYETFTLPQGGGWNKAVYGDGKFVVIGDSNKTACSTDGVNWIETTLPDDVSFIDAVYADGKFVAINYYSDKAAYSEDGINWTITTMPSNNSWKSIAYGGGKFVAVARGYDKVAYSEDGITWKQTTRPTMKDCLYVAYGNGKFVAILDRYDSVLYSEDGVTWYEKGLPTDTYEWSSITYGDGKFVIVAHNFDQAVYSEDGVNWSLAPMPSQYYWDDVCYGNGIFVAIGGRDWDDTKAAYSYDGINWEETALPKYNVWTLSYCGDRFLTVSYQYDNALYSYDGITWYEQKLIADYHAIYQDGEDVTESATQAIKPYLSVDVLTTEQLAELSALLEGV